MQVLLILLSIIPGIVISLIIYFSDKKEREPIREVLTAFALGIAAIILTLVISTIFSIIKIEASELDLFELILYSFIGIALIEELCKWICCYALISKSKNFNYIYDGIVYFSIVALGFATVENVLYSLSVDLNTLLIRAVLTVPAHAFFGITSGYYYILSVKEKNKGNKSKKTLYLILSILIPTLLHGIYDFLLLSQNELLFGIFIIFVASLYVITISRAKKTEANDRTIE